MKVLTLICAVAAAVGLPAHAETYDEMAKFAQSICGDIPAGNLTRTEIEGKVKANVGLFAKLVSGGADVGAKREQEIYEGIPFDKLPSNIPTVSMCKLELIKVLAARKTASINVCRHPDFGQEGWKRTEVYKDSSGRLDGGHDQGWWCNQVKSAFIQSRSIGPLNTTETLGSSEEPHKDWKGHVTYKYHCTVRVNWDPLYYERQDPRCGVTVQ